MAISLIAVGGWATGTTSLSVAYPAGIQAGDLLVLAIANKYPTNSPTAPTDWVIPSNGQQSGGSGTNGIDTGNVYATVMVKIATGSESGSLTVNISSGDSAVAEMGLYRKAADKSWEYVCTNGSDNSAGSAWSVTGAANPGITGDDRMFTCSGINTDSYTFSSHALAATGVTFGAVQADGSGTSGGEDCYCVLTDHVVSSGTASAAPTFTMSASGTTTDNPAGATVFMRMREVTPGNSQIAGSSTGASSGSGNVSGKGALSGVGTAGGTATAIILAIGQLIGISSGSSTASSQLSAKGNVTAGATAIATVSGQINAKGILSGTSAGLSTATGTASTGSFIIGSTAGLSTSTGTLIGFGRVAGSSAGTSTAVLTWQATVTNKILILTSPIKTSIKKSSVISSSISQQSRIKQLI